MAWNSNQAVDVTSAKAPNHGVITKSMKLYLILILTIATFLGVLIYCLSHNPPVEIGNEVSADNSRINFSTSICCSAKVEKSLPSPKADELPPQKVGELRDGYRLLANGKLHKVYGIITNRMDNHRAKSSIFKHRSDNIIAGLIAAKPGATMVGEWHFNGAFTKDFFDSLHEPIVIYPDDSDYDKNLKSLVIEARQNLLNAANRGEDIEQIILDSRKECQELARYKQVLEKNLYEYVLKDDVSDEDVDTYIQAANLMLEGKGIAPINPGPITRVKIKVKEGEL